MLYKWCFLFKIRKNKRDEVMDKKRSLGGATFAPFLVAIIPLHDQIDAQSALSILKTCDPDAVASVSATGITHITYDSYYIYLSNYEFIFNKFLSFSFSLCKI